MATYTDDFPFAGVAYAKYLQLLDIEPEWVEQVSNEELEDYLQSVAESYQQRYEELVAIGLNHALAKNPEIRGAEQQPILERQIELQAEEIARHEFLY